MNAEADRALRNLTIVGLLKQNDKLLTTGDTFAIHPPSYSRGIYRMWCGECRESNIQRLRETVEFAFQFVVHNTSPDAEAPGISSSLRQCSVSRMIQALHQSGVGLFKLVDTYSDDVTMQVRLRLLAQYICDTLSVAQHESDSHLRLDELSLPSCAVVVASTRDC
jgi:hypothetical protein